MGKRPAVENMKKATKYADTLKSFTRKMLREHERPRQPQMRCGRWCAGQ